MFLEFETCGMLMAAPAAQHENYFERGLTCSGGATGMDLVEAHKWFNLAAIHGDDRGAAARVDVALDMTQREIAEAQRRARAFMGARAH